MEINVRIYSCNIETYKKFYKDAVAKAYAKDGITIDPDKIKIIIEELPGETIQSQRSVEKHTRTISVYEDDELKYIIGFSNTNYDDDKQLEVETKGGKYVYGVPQYHSNTYLFQGINKIFEYYYDEKEKNPNVKLYFYLLDTDQSYAKNLSNLINYRKLATIGFEILNLDKISFKEFEKIGFSSDEDFNDIKYVSFNKFANDILFLSKKNTGNVPSYLKCIDEEYDITKEKEDTDQEQTINEQKYIYTFKTLSAEGYDSFLTMWTLLVLAQNENKNLEFFFASEIYHLSEGEENYRYSTGFTGPILRLIEKAGLDIQYETSDEILHQFEREKNQYETAKANNILRNQELFRNNMRAKGLETKCYLCGCEVEEILEAAHLWGVGDIKKASRDAINELMTLPHMHDLIDKDNPHCNENFYKKYVLANSGDNGVWLCSNHHGMFDSHYYCFDSENGKVLFDIAAKDEAKEFFQEITVNNGILEYVLTDRTKEFLSRRMLEFENKNKVGEEL